MKEIPVCQVCHEKKIKFLFVKNKVKYFLCRKCGLKFVWPLPKKGEIKKFYQADYWRRRAFRGKTIVGYLDYYDEKESLLDYFEKIWVQLQNLYPSLKGDNQKILDIGCGPGYFLKVVQEAGTQIYGVDLSSSAVTKARQSLKTKNIILGELASARFKDDFFDLVTCFQTIEHLPDLNIFLKEAWRILKSGGGFIISTPNAAGWKARMMSSLWLSFRHPDHFYFFDFANLGELLERNGFVKIKKIKDPARVYELGYYGLGLLKYFLPFAKGEKVIKIIGPLAKIKISIPLDSLVVIAQKP